MTIILNPERLGTRGRIPRPLRDRIEEKIERDGSGCWIWTGTLDLAGYGRIWTGSRVTGDRTATLAHRAAWEVYVGPIPDGLVLDHLCRMPPCVNPAHLEPVTQRENVLRGDAPSAACAKRTHCPKGHPYDEENTLHYRNKRYCIACRKTPKAAK